MIAQMTTDAAGISASEFAHQVLVGKTLIVMLAITELFAVAHQDSEAKLKLDVWEIVSILKLCSCCFLIKHECFHKKINSLKKIILPHFFFLITAPVIRDLPPAPPIDPCDPSPCGLNADCRVRVDRPVCSCPRGYEGDPLTNCIRGECIG